MFRSTLTRFAVTVASAVVALMSAAHASAAPGAVYTLTNSTSGNAVVAYSRGEFGVLRPAGVYPTGGTGTGAGLNSQGAVVVNDTHSLLFAVNAGSNSISSFRIRPNGLQFVDVQPSGGLMPTSVAYQDGRLYVLNAGVPNRLTAFLVGSTGRLTPIQGAAAALSADATSPGQVGFSADGSTLIVTERATNRIDTYAVGADGRLTGPFVHTSAGPTPYGFAVSRRNTLLVSEAGAGGGASTYHVDAGNGLVPVSAMLMSGQRAACWAAVTGNGRFGYIANAGTGNITGVALDTDGSATLLDADGVTAVTGGNPTDLAISHDSRFLYARVSNLGEIAVFSIRGDGSLVALPALTGVPATIVGLAAF